MHANAVTEEAMEQFDNLMKHAVNPADVESDEIDKNIVQLLDKKLEYMSKKSRSSKLWIQYIKMLVILRKFMKAEMPGNLMFHLQTVRDMLRGQDNACTKSGYIDMCRMANMKHSDTYVYDHY